MAQDRIELLELEIKQENGHAAAHTAARPHPRDFYQDLSADAKLVVIAADFDGCCEDKKLLEIFINRVKNKNPEATIVLAVGSNRQDALINMSNRRDSDETRDCYISFRQFAQKNEIHFETSLVVDVCQQAFDWGHGIAKSHEDESAKLCSHCVNILFGPRGNEQPRYYNPGNKAPIFVALAQRIASALPEQHSKQIKCYFIDDRRDIIEETQGTLTRHPELLPRAVELQCFYYDKDDNRDLDAIDEDDRDDSDYSIYKIGKEVNGKGVVLDQQQLKKVWHATFTHEYKEPTSGWCGLFRKPAIAQVVVRSESFVSVSVSATAEPVMGLPNFES